MECEEDEYEGKGYSNEWQIDVEDPSLAGLGQQ